MRNIAARVAKLHTDIISEVSSEIIIKDKEKVLRRTWRGTNREKVIRIVVRLGS